MKIFNLFLLVLNLVSFYSCKKILGIPDCELPLVLGSSSVQIIFKDSATKRYLFDEDRPLYSKDSVEVFDPQGASLRVLFSLNSDEKEATTRFWAIDFGSVFDDSTDSASFSQEICKDFIVRYSFNRQDTITTCFKSVNKKCGSLFSTLKVYHKGRLLASETNTTSATVTIIKN